LAQHDFLTLTSPVSHNLHHTAHWLAMPTDWPPIARDGTAFNAGGARFDRAVSTAYYAVFVSLAALVADHLVPAGMEQEDWRKVFKSVEHRRCQVALETIANSAGSNGELAWLPRLSAIFKELKAAREKADYSPWHHYSMDEAGDLMRKARLGGSYCDTLRDNDGLRTAFVVSCLLPKRQQQS
jgi:hypothetical protein